MRSLKYITFKSQERRRMNILAKQQRRIQQRRINSLAKRFESWDTITPERTPPHELLTNVPLVLPKLDTSGTPSISPVSTPSPKPDADQYYRAHPSPPVLCEAVPGEAAHRDAVPVYATQLMLPEWMLSTPPNFNEWIALPKLDGERVMVVCTHGSALLRRANGEVIGTFYLPLPGGRPHDARSSVLDGVLRGERLFIVDAMSWNDEALRSRSFLERRQFLLDNFHTAADIPAEDAPELSDLFPLEQAEHGDKQASPFRRILFPDREPSPTYEPARCDARQLFEEPPALAVELLPHCRVGALAADTFAAFAAPGFLFYEPNSFYLSGYSPLALMWRRPPR
eukprot:gnl/Chilomastix_cuspidata/4358.p1 GENE.gnl/Chilomastix_cuspidata/4358~~gnl/Chilomastix_cuspidata/4358.p1  ORF type:complete len:340 (-),score=150.63 gnl/Chilomastix_cuspidata/4358:18-1037(-)